MARPRKRAEGARRMSLAIDDDLQDWLVYAAGLKCDGNQTAYLNMLVRADMENAPEAVREHFEQQLKLKDELLGGE